jgi:hypothetical protein
MMLALQGPQQGRPTEVKYTFSESRDLSLPKKEATVLTWDFGAP